MTMAFALQGPSKAVRRISGVERIFLAGERISPPATTCLVIEGEGSLDPIRWREAWSETLLAWPGTRLVWRGALGASHWASGGPEPPLHRSGAGTWDGRGSEGAAFLEDGMDPRVGPLVDLRIVSGPLLRVVLRTHHGIMDGRATLDLARDLFRVLRGENPHGALAGPLTVEDLVERAPRVKVETPRLDCLSPLGPASSEFKGTLWRRRLLPGSRHHRLLPRLLVALGRAAGVGQDIRVGIPVDMRPFEADLPGVSANLTGMVRLQLRPLLGTTDPVQAVAEDLARRLRAREDAAGVAPYAAFRHVPVSWMAAVGRWGARRNLARDRYALTALVSNLGRLGLDEASGGGFAAQSAFILPTPSPGVPLVLMLLGTGAGIGLSGLAPTALASEGRLDGLLDRVTSLMGDTAT